MHKRQDKKESLRLSIQITLTMHYFLLLLIVRILYLLKLFGLLYFENNADQLQIIINIKTTQIIYNILPPRSLSRNLLEANWRTKEEFEISTDWGFGFMNPYDDPMGDLGSAPWPPFHKFHSTSRIPLTSRLITRNIKFRLILIYLPFVMRHWTTFVYVVL